MSKSNKFESFELILRIHFHSKYTRVTQFPYTLYSMCVRVIENLGLTFVFALRVSYVCVT